MIEAILGLLVAVLSIALARAVKGEGWGYSAGLIALPVIYILFALCAGDHAAGMQELVFGVPFILCGVLLAVVNVSLSAMIVGGLWLLHGLYDLVHGWFFTNPGVPGWYPVFCASVDVAIGMYVLRLAFRLPKSNLRAAG